MCAKPWNGSAWCSHRLWNAIGPSMIWLVDDSVAVALGRERGQQLRLALVAGGRVEQRAEVPLRRRRACRACRGPSRTRRRSRRRSARKRSQSSGAISRGGRSEPGARAAARRSPSSITLSRLAVLRVVALHCSCLLPSASPIGSGPAPAFAGSHATHGASRSRRSSQRDERDAAADRDPEVRRRAPAQPGRRRAPRAASRGRSSRPRPASRGRGRRAAARDPRRAAQTPLDEPLDQPVLRRVDDVVDTARGPPRAPSPSGRAWRGSPRSRR